MGVILYLFARMSSFTGVIRHVVKLMYENVSSIMFLIIKRKEIARKYMIMSDYVVIDSDCGVMGVMDRLTFDYSGR